MPSTVLGPSPCSLPRGHGRRIQCLASAGRPGVVMVGDELARLGTWDLRSGAAPGPPECHDPDGCGLRVAVGWAGGRWLDATYTHLSVRRVAPPPRFVPLRAGEGAERPLLALEAQPGLWFRAAALSPSGELLAVATEDGAVDVHEVGEERPRSRVRAPGGPPPNPGRLAISDEAWVALLTDGALEVCVGGPKDGVSRDLRGSSLAIAPTSGQVLLGCKDGGLQLWDRSLRVLLGQVRGAHAGAIAAVGFGPNGQTMVSCGVDKQVCIYRMAFSGLVRTSRFRVCDGGPSFFDHPTAVLLPDEHSVVVGAGDGAVRCFNSNGMRTAEIAPYREAVIGVRRWGATEVVASAGDRLFIWNPGRLEGRVQVFDDPQGDLGGRARPSPDGSLLITHCFRPSVAVWRREAEGLVPIGRIREGIESDICDMEWAGAGRIALVDRNRRLHLANLRSGRVERQVPGLWWSLRQTGRALLGVERRGDDGWWVRDLASEGVAGPFCFPLPAVPYLSPSGSYLVLSGVGRTAVWRLPARLDGPAEAPLLDLPGGASSGPIAFTPDERCLVEVGWDGSVAMCALDQPREVGRARWHLSEDYEQVFWTPPLDTLHLGPRVGHPVAAVGTRSGRIELFRFPAAERCGALVILPEGNWVELGRDGRTILRCSNRAHRYIFSQDGIGLDPLEVPGSVLDR